MGSSTKKAQSVFNIISMNSPEMYFALGAFLFGAVSALQTRSTVVIQEIQACSADTDCEMSNDVCNKLQLL